MKLRFGIDAAVHEKIRGRLDALSDELPVGRKLVDVYLDTPDGELAAHGVALRFRRTSALGAPSSRRAWRRQEVWSKGSSDRESASSINKLGIRRLKQRLGATFSVRVERWTWRPRGSWAVVSLDTIRVATGPDEDAFAELRIVCKRKRADDAMHLAVELGAMHLSSLRTRERGMALLERAR